jgi:hypothetical protein
MVKCITTVITLLNDTTSVELEGGGASVESDSEGLLCYLSFDFGDGVLDLSPFPNFTHSLASVMFTVALSASGA